MRVEHIILAGDAAAVYSTLGRCESYTLGTGSAQPEIAAPSAIGAAERRFAGRLHAIHHRRAEPRSQKSEKEL